MDSRSISANPLYNAFKAKSFTAGDVTFHFYILDLLCGGEAYTAQEILNLFCGKYLCRFESDWQPDISTIRKKLKEYVSLGILTSEKRGRELYYSRAADSVDLQAWADTIAFFSEEDPLGVVGSTMLDKLKIQPDYFQHKHHYMLHALDSRILLELLTAIGGKKAVQITHINQRRTDSPAVHTVCPLKIFISTQGGRQYLLCYHYRFRKMMFFRLDFIQTVEAGAEERNYARYEGFYRKFLTHLWGTDARNGGAFSGHLLCGAEHRCLPQLFSHVLRESPTGGDQGRNHSGKGSVLPQLQRSVQHQHPEGL